MPDEYGQTARAGVDGGGRYSIATATPRAASSSPSFRSRVNVNLDDVTAVLSNCSSFRRADADVNTPEVGSTHPELPPRMVGSASDNVFDPPRDIFG